MTGSFSESTTRMRDADWVSESEQWTTTSCADHSPGFGLHWSASLGTIASAARRRRGPSAYWSINLVRSSGLKAMEDLRSGAAGQRARELVEVVVVVAGHEGGPVCERDPAEGGVQTAAFPLFG